MSAEMEVLISEFLNADELQQQGLWKQADIVLTVRERFGRNDRKGRAAALRAFASEVSRSAVTLRQYARTAEFFPEEMRVSHLTFTHHKIAATFCPDASAAQTAIGHAAEELWSTRQLQDVLVKQFGVKLDAILEETDDERLLCDGQDVLDVLRRFAGLRVRIQLRVVGEEED